MQIATRNHLVIELVISHNDGIIEHRRHRKYYGEKSWISFTFLKVPRTTGINLTI